MNFGDIYLKSFAVIVGASFLIAVMIASPLRFWRRTSWQTVVLTALPIWLILGFLALDWGHRRLFVTWHRWQNTALPSDGCLTYEPSFARLYATYEMTRDEFKRWARNHPWELQPSGNELLPSDGPRLGLDSPELCFASEMGPNGKQLRVYYKTGTMYVSYNSM